MTFLHSPQDADMSSRSSDFYLRLDKAICEVLPHYGDKCANCGETTRKFLLIDTVVSNPKRSDVVGLALKTYADIKKSGFPKGKFQVLCANCSKGRHLNGGVFIDRKSR